MLHLKVRLFCFELRLLQRVDHTQLELIVNVTDYVLPISNPSLSFSAIKRSFLFNMNGIAGSMVHFQDGPWFAPRGSVHYGRPGRYSMAGRVGTLWQAVVIWL